MINLKFSKKEEPFYDVEMDKDGNIFYTNEKHIKHNLKGPAIEYRDGSKIYRVNGELHRIDGPAVEFSSGRTEYWVNGKLHRLDGPARIWPDGSVEYWVNDKQVTKEEFDRLTKHND